MIHLKRIFIIASVLVLAGCSYFDTGERIEVTSQDLDNEPVFVDGNGFEQIVYQKTDGAVEVYNLDMDEQDAINSFPALHGPQEKSEDAMSMNSSVEVYPIDIPMQKTLKP